MFVFVSQYLGLFSTPLPCDEKLSSFFFLPFFFEHEEGRADHNTLSPAGLDRIHYRLRLRLQLQHGLECEESFWAGVLAQGSKPHIAAALLIFPSLFAESDRLGSERCASLPLQPLQPPGGCVCVGGGGVQGVAADK